MSKPQDIVLEVEGMSCPLCVGHIREALANIAGVNAVDVKLDDGLVVVKHDAGRAPLAKLLVAMEQAGYESRPRA